MVSKALWETLAIPAIFYANEACVINKQTIKEISTYQNKIARFITGLPSETSISALMIESGMIPIQARHHIEVFRFFKRIREGTGLSVLVTQAIEERWNSSYKQLIRTIIVKYELWSTTEEEGKQKMLFYYWKEEMKDIYTMKSTVGMSVRGDRWTLPGHITDTTESTVLAKFRTDSAGLGNRTPLKGFSSKICILCDNFGAERPLEEVHIMFQRKLLHGIQTSLELLKHRFTQRGSTTKEVMKKYVVGDGCSDTELKKRGRGLEK